MPSRARPLFKVSGRHTLLLDQCRVVAALVQDGNIIALLHLPKGWRVDGANVGTSLSLCVCMCVCVPATGLGRAGHRFEDTDLRAHATHVAHNRPAAKASEEQ